MCYERHWISNFRVWLTKEACKEHHPKASFKTVINERTMFHSASRMLTHASSVSAEYVSNSVQNSDINTGATFNQIELHPPLDIIVTYDH